MRKSSLGSAVVICAVAISACSSPGATDGRAADVGSGDRRPVDIRGRDVGHADVDAPNAIWREEACLDAKATQPPLIAWTSSWGQSSNAAFMPQITSEARRCQWTSLNDKCTMYDCLASDWTGAAATMKGPSAGKITVGIGSGQDAVLVPDADGVYAIKSWGTAHWKEGDQITFAAEGALIPTFALTIGFPTPVAASNPLAKDAGTASAIDRSAALTFSWTPTDEKVIVMFAQLPGLASLWDRRELWCVFDGSASTGTVPTDVLQHLKLGLSTGFGIAHYNRRCYKRDEFHLQATGTSGTWWDATVK